MTLTQFDVVAEAPVKRKSKVRKTVSYLLTEIIVPLLIVLLSNTIGFGVSTGFFVLAHYFNYAKPYGQSESSKSPRGFALCVVLLILVHSVIIVLNMMAMSCVLDTTSITKKDRRVTHVVGWSLMALCWFVYIIGMAAEGFAENLFGFKEKVTGVV